MGRGVNKVIIIGNLGADPEVRYAPTGTVFAEISVATSITWKDKNTGQQKEHVEWTRCAFSGRLAEVVGEYLKKGAKVYCEGRLHTNKWTDAQGQDQYKTVVRVSEMQMLDRQESSSDVSQNYQQQNSGTQNAPAAKPQSTDAKPKAGQQPAVAPQAAPQTGFTPNHQQGAGGGFSSFDDDIPFAKLRFAEGG